MSLFPAYGDDTDADVYAKLRAESKAAVSPAVVKYEPEEEGTKPFSTSLVKSEGRGSSEEERYSRERRKQKARSRSRSRTPKKKKKKRKYSSSPERKKKKKKKKHRLLSRSSSPDFRLCLVRPEEFFRTSVFLSGKPPELKDWLTLDTRPDASLKQSRLNPYTTAVPRFDRKLSLFLAGPSLKRPRRKMDKEDKEPRYFAPRKKPLEVSWSFDVNAVKKLSLEDDDAGYVPVPRLEDPGAASSSSRSSARAAYTIVNSNDPLGVYDGATAAYAQGEAHVKDPEDYLTVVDRTELRDQVARLNRAVTEDPHDVPAWLELARIQDAVVAEDFKLTAAKDGGEKSVRASTRTVAEKKLAVLEKALSKLPASVPLVLEKLELSKILLSGAELRREWGYLNFRHPADVGLWKESLVFAETHLLSFNVRNGTKAFADAFAKLKLIKDGVMVSHRAPRGFGSDLADLLAWCANFFAATGYFEKGLALFQALVEFNLFAPETTARKEVLFEAFWDSRRPRVGEELARGWADTMADPAPPGGELARDVGFEDLEERLANDAAASRAGKWLAIENARCEWHWLPWDAARGDDEVEDPDRLVAFDDVAPFLLDLSASPRHRFKLLVNFLVYLGARLDGAFYGARVWVGFTEPNLEFLPPAGFEFLDALAPYRPAPSESEVVGVYSAFVDRVFTAGIGCFGGTRRRALRHWKLLHEIGRDDPSSRASAKRILGRIKSVLREPESRDDVDLFRLYANRLAKFRRLKEAYDVYATALSAVSSTDAREGGGGGRPTSDLVLTNVAKLALAHDYLRALVSDTRNAENKKAALWLLAHVSDGCRNFAAPGGGDPGPSDERILEAADNFSDVQTRLLEDPLGESGGGEEEDDGGGEEMDVFFVPTLATSSADVLVSWTSCHAWFVYLTTGSLDRAGAVFRDVLGEVKARMEDAMWAQAGGRFDRRPSARECAFMVAYERLHVEHAALMYRGMKFNEVTPRSFREVLLNALTDVPASEQLLSYFHGDKLNATHLRSLRQHVQKVVPDRVDDPFLVLSAVRTELERNRRICDQAISVEDSEADPADRKDGGWKMVGAGNVLLSMLERALNGRKTRHCSLLWRVRMRVLHTLGKKAEVKSVFYHALEQAPFCKSLYLDVVQYIPEMLKEVVDLMSEKQLRVRLPLEELDVLCEPVGAESDEEMEDESAQETGTPPREEIDA